MPINPKDQEHLNACAHNPGECAVAARASLENILDALSVPKKRGLLGEMNELFLFISRNEPKTGGP